MSFTTREMGYICCYVHFLHHLKARVCAKVNFPDLRIEMKHLLRCKTLMNTLYCSGQITWLLCSPKKLAFSMNPKESFIKTLSVHANFDIKQLVYKLKKKWKPDRISTCNFSDTCQFLNLGRS